MMVKIILVEDCGGGSLWLMLVWRLDMKDGAVLHALYSSDVLH